MSKDAEIERAFAAAERDMERQPKATPGAIFTRPVPIWEDPEPCPACGSDQVFKMDTGRPGAEQPLWKGSCVDCGWWWDIETVPSPTAERENDGT